MASKTYIWDPELKTMIPKELKHHPLEDRQKWVDEDKPREKTHKIQPGKPPAIGDPVLQGVTKAPKGFREGVLGKIKRAHPLGYIDAD